MAMKGTFLQAQTLGRELRIVAHLDEKALDGEGKPLPETVVPYVFGIDAAPGNPAYAAEVQRYVGEARLLVKEEQRRREAAASVGVVTLVEQGKAI